MAIGYPRPSIMFESPIFVRLLSPPHTLSVFGSSLFTHCAPKLLPLLVHTFTSYLASFGFYSPLTLPLRDSDKSSFSVHPYGHFSAIQTMSYMVQRTPQMCFSKSNIAPARFGSYS